MNNSKFIGKDSTKTKIYQSIKDCDNMPDALKEKALFYLTLIVKSPTIYYCDEYDLRLCFKWNLGQPICAGNFSFWQDVNDYLTMQKQK